MRRKGTLGRTLSVICVDNIAGKLKEFLKVCLLFLFLSAPQYSFSEETNGEPKPPNTLLQALEDGEREVFKREGSEALKAEKLNDIEFPSFYKSQPKTPNEEIAYLLDEVEKLKSKVVLTKKVALSTSGPKKSKQVGSHTVYTFREGQIYEIHAGVDRVTDLKLELGETLTNPPVSGDTTRWKISLLSSGSGTKEVFHLIIKPIEEEIETNILITTNRRVYHLRALSSDWYMPSVSFEYPEDEERDLREKLGREKESEAIGLKPEELEFNYRVKGKQEWAPLRVFDDGAKTYIQMPANLASMEAPAFFILSEDGEPELVNYRVKGVYYIVDRLFTKAEMRVGPKSVVEIFSPKYRQSFFEALF